MPKQRLLVVFSLEKLEMVLRYQIRRSRSREWVCEKWKVVEVGQEGAVCCVLLKPRGGGAGVEQGKSLRWW